MQNSLHRWDMSKDWPLTALREYPSCVFVVKHSMKNWNMSVRNYVTGLQPRYKLSCRFVTTAFHHLTQTHFEISPSAVKHHSAIQGRLHSFPMCHIIRTFCGNDLYFISDGQSPQTQNLIYQTIDYGSTSFVVKSCAYALPHQKIIYNE